MPIFNVRKKYFKLKEGAEMKNLKLIYRVLLGFILILLMCYIFYIIVFSNINEILTVSINKELNASKSSSVFLIKASLNSAIDNYLRAVAETNYDILNEYYNKVQKGELTKEQALSEVYKIFSTQKVGSSGYIWCINSQGIFVYHPKSQNVGTSAIKYDFIKKIIEIKHGIVPYKWKNPGETVERDKIGYSKYFEPWDIYICPSVYTEELNELFHIQVVAEELKTYKIGEKVMFIF